MAHCKEKQMRKLIPAAALIASTLVLAPGCFTVAEEAYYKVKGAVGLFVEIKPVASFQDHLSLSQYTRFELGEMRDEFAGKVPFLFIPDLQAEFPRALADSRIYQYARGRTLLIRGSIIYYEHAGTLGVVLGDIEEVLARVELVDKATGKVVGTAMCVGRSVSRSTMGVNYKAEGLARAIVLWIQAYYPKREGD